MRGFSVHLSLQRDPRFARVLLPPCGRDAEGLPGRPGGARPLGEGVASASSSAPLPGPLLGTRDWQARSQGRSLGVEGRGAGRGPHGLSPGTTSGNGLLEEAGEGDF